MTVNIEHSIVNCSTALQITIDWTTKSHCVLSVASNDTGIHVYVWKTSSARLL